MEYEITTRGVKLNEVEKHQIVMVECLEDSVIRVRYAIDSIIDQSSRCIVSQALKLNCHFTIKNLGNSLLLTTAKVSALISLEDGCVTWSDTKQEHIYLREARRSLAKKTVYSYQRQSEGEAVKRVKTVDGERSFVNQFIRKEEGTAYRGKYVVNFQEGEGIYGFGQGEEGYYNLRNHTKYLYQHNLRIPMPMFYSDVGYGILFDCCSLMTFQEDENESYIFMDTIDQMDYYFIAGPSPDEVIRGFRLLTGKAAMLPKWAYGYIQSKEQYYSSDELYDIVNHYRSLHVPIDCVVQDWNSWEPGHWGEKKLDQKRYGNIDDCIQKIHKLNAHTMISIWPNMSPDSDDHKEMKEKKFLLDDEATYNAFLEDAQKLYWKQMQRGLFCHGFDSWWCDSTEPFSGPDWNGEEKREPWERYQLVGDQHIKFLGATKANVYSLAHVQGIYDHQRKYDQKKRVLLLSRSGYAGSQRYGTVLWSGDIAASWDTLKRQIVEGLNMGLSGYPFWTLDIGAFFTVHKKWKNRGCNRNMDSTMKWFWCGDFEDGVKDRGYRELYVRWLEFGVFLPMFRSHGTDTPREIWNFGEPGDMFYDAIKKNIELRYMLLPYIYSIAGGVRVFDETFMRSLLFDFRDDLKARAIKDEFMFGKNLLICPVTEPMYYLPNDIELLGKEKSRRCYLPGGTEWIDFWTNQRYDGGNEITVSAPIDHIPIFVKGGSILPCKNGMEYANDKENEPFILRIYPGADASFTLYEDAGDGYEYEKGEYSLISMEWKDREQVLIINDRTGSYVGMQERRVFIIELTGRAQQKALYDGATQVMQF